MPDMPILRCSDLSKTYKNGENAVHALRGITIAFEQGDFCAVRGPSGSGKSTLLHILGGLEFPTSGKVYYQGEDLFAYNDNQLSILRRRRFGFVFQAYNLVQELTAYENILLPVLLDKRNPDEKYIAMLVELLGLADRLHHLPNTLSGGQQQRVAIARALANRPSILFADEPTGNLDGKTGKEVLSLLKYASKEMGVTLILVTHDLHIAEQAERIITLEDGGVADDG